MSTNYPNHKNQMAKSILCTVFCCLITGIIAIINSSRANELYNSALIVNDETQKNMLLAQSAEANEKAKSMIRLSVILGIISAIVNAFKYIAQSVTM